MKKTQSFKIIVIRIFRILFGLVSIGVWAVWIFQLYSYIINSHEHVYTGFVPEHYGIFDPKEHWSRWYEFFTSMDLYFSLVLLVGGIGLVSLKRWGAYLGLIAYGILLIGFFIHQGLALGILFMLSLFWIVVSWKRMHTIYWKIINPALFIILVLVALLFMQAMANRKVQHDIEQREVERREKASKDLTVEGVVEVTP